MSRSTPCPGRSIPGATDDGQPTEGSRDRSRDGDRPQAARRLGFPNADRLTLAGRLDRGDVGLCPGVVLEVKGGDAARIASDGDIGRWLDETERERVNAHAAHAFLVVQRGHVGAINAHRWWAWWRLSWLATLGPHQHPRRPDPHADPHDSR